MIRRLIAWWRGRPLIVHPREIMRHATPTQRFVAWANTPIDDEAERAYSDEFDRLEEEERRLMWVQSNVED